MTASDTRRLRHVFRSCKEECKQWARKLQMPVPAFVLLSLTLCAPRAKGRPLGVGLQLSVKEKAAIAACSPSTVHRARRLHVARRLVYHFEQTRSVRAITRHRKPEQRLTVIKVWHKVKGLFVQREHRFADIIPVDYPNHRAFDLVASVDPKGQRHAAGGLFQRLAAELETRCARFLERSSFAQRPRRSDTPSNVVSSLRERTTDFQPPATGPPAAERQGIARAALRPFYAGRLPGGRSPKSTHRAPGSGGRRGGWTDEQLDELAGWAAKARRALERRKRSSNEGGPT